jgi:hypothetical protein
VITVTDAVHVAVMPVSYSCDSQSLRDTSAAIAYDASLCQQQVQHSNLIALFAALANVIHTDIQICDSPIW